MNRDQLSSLEPLTEQQLEIVFGGDQGQRGVGDKPVKYVPGRIDWDAYGVNAPPMSPAN